MTVRAKHHPADDIRRSTDWPILRAHLEIGRPLIPGAGFATDADFAAAWEMCRDDLLAAWLRDHPGTRPYAWWRCDRGCERPTDETGSLLAAGLLTDDERRRLRLD